jgi:hypothetical protein
MQGVERDQVVLAGLLEERRDQARHAGQAEPASASRGRTRKVSELSDKAEADSQYIRSHLLIPFCTISISS